MDRELIGTLAVLIGEMARPGTTVKWVTGRERTVPRIELAKIARLYYLLVLRMGQARQ